jgi:tetratricopeptide (TPR) repeat protein
LVLVFPHRPLLMAAALAVVAAPACAPLALPATPGKPAAAADFEAAISRLEKDDPQSPEALNARLEYADFLTEPQSGTMSGPESGAESNDCQPRLDTAQAQLDTLATRSALHVLLPLGAARLANGEYKLHMARAGCGGDPSHRDGELQQALEAARNAAGLYRDALDYQSSAIMQFNIAAAGHELGHDSAAISALNAAIAMDREYGYFDDAQDNYKLLLRWRKEEDSDANVAALMKDFPARSAEFKFNWSGSDADIAVEAEAINVAGANVIHSRGAIALKRQVRADMRNWTVSYEPGNATYDLGDQSGKNGILQQFTAYLVTGALVRPPKIEISRTGDFEDVHDARAFGQTLSAQMTARFGDAAPAVDEPAGASQTVAQNLKSVFSPQYVEADAAEKYNLETSIWIGAKLEQGVWYQMSAPLFLPGLGLGQVLVSHGIQFSYTRQVACKPGAADLACAEIVIHATPDAKDLKLTSDQIARTLKFAEGQSLHYWSTTDMRLVVSPDTLVPYICDTRRYWYVAIDGTANGDSIFSSEKVVAASTYH